MYIDSHVHFWKLIRGDYGWLQPEDTVLYRDYMPVQLLPSLQAHGVDGLIAVQAAPTVAETEFLLQLSDEFPIISGVVGGLNPLDAEFADQLDQLSKHPRFVGVRLNGNLFHEKEGRAGESLLEALRLLEESGLALDLLVRPADYSHVYVWLERFPRLKAIINHMGSPLVQLQQLGRWTEWTERLAVLPAVMMKLSGLITQTTAGKSHREQLQPYIDHLAVTFGAERLMFGSDWPVALLAGGYGQVINLFEDLLAGKLKPEELERVRARNAALFYGLAE